ncbi:hypothetical protein DJ69_01835 [Halorubrum persicum]|uniref:Uncharacterized protein n=1 Tax=Halorubrum persicum TaxID=1383844 RepID=A0A2G1WMP1_9EURY|nr:hypothetical protein [Halorubrum persicum]PHQ40223.1 hypothetical protein DJ69_01835 [Halorubrum persicum]
MTNPNPSRRRLLTGGVAAAAGALAGCLDGSVTGGPADGDDDRVLALTLDDAGDTLRDTAVVDLAAAGPGWDEAAFKPARNGERYTTQYRKPFPSASDDPTYAAHEGTYYRLSSVVVDEAEATRPVLRLFEADGVDGGNGTDAGGETDDDGNGAVGKQTLPAGDRRAVEIAHFSARARGDVGGVPVGLVERGGYVYRDADAIDASELLDGDGPSRVTYRDTVYRVAVTRERFYEPVYRAVAEPVAESPERMEAIVRARTVGARIEGDDLSADARAVIDAAARGGYEESHPYSDGYAEVLRAIHERPYLDGNIRKDAGWSESGSERIRYDDRYYDYRLQFQSA